jgi:hypothetical protein
LKQFACSAIIELSTGSSAVRTCKGHQKVFIIRAPNIARHDIPCST